MAIWRHTDEDGDQAELYHRGDNEWVLTIPSASGDRSARAVYLDDNALFRLGDAIEKERTR